MRKWKLLSLSLFRLLRGDDCLRQFMNLGSKYYTDLVFSICTDDKGDEILVCSRRELNYHPPVGLVRIILKDSGNYDFQVLMISKDKGTLNEFYEYKELLNMVGEYKFCPGFDSDVYNTTYFDVIRYDPKGVRRTTQPIARIDSQGCLLWHKLASIFEKAVMCSSCKRLKNILEQRIKKIKTVSPSKKSACIQPSSNFPLKYLSPQSVERKQKKYIKNAREIRSKYSGMDVTLHDDQNEEMSTLVKQISEIGSEELKSAIEEGDKHQCGVGSTIKAIWDNDITSMKQEFNNDQKENS